MELEHFLALIPLMILLIVSIIWYGKGLLHLITLAYAIILGIIAINGSYGALFFPICAGSAIIALILFFIAMTRGDWL